MTAIAVYLANDSYAPATPKPSLQQYDNYQIYDVSCVDRLIDKIDYNGVSSQHAIIQTSFLAVQAYSVTPIGCDFNAIINQYK